MSGLKFIQITDCHLLNQRSELMQNINTYESLSKIIDHIGQKQITYDFLLVTGDISQDASKESYDSFNSLIKKLNKPVYCLPGNHDDPTLLKNLFKQSPDKAISVNLVQSHLLILLNSHVKGLESGEISENQLHQLGNILRTNQHRPVIIAIHHQPVNINSPWMDKIGLGNSDELLALLENFPMIKMLLFGHVHQEIDKDHQHIKIMGTPSTCYQFKPQNQTMLTDSVAPGYRVIELLNNGTIKTEVCRINQ